MSMIDGNLGGVASVTTRMRSRVDLRPESLSTPYFPHVFLPQIPRIVEQDGPVGSQKVCARRPYEVTSRHSTPTSLVRVPTWRHIGPRPRDLGGWLVSARPE